MIVLQCFHIWESTEEINVYQNTDLANIVIHNDEVEMKKNCVYKYKKIHSPWWDGFLNFFIGEALF